MLRFLQNYPHALEVIYDVFELAARPFQRWLKPDGGRIERAVIWGEELGKRAVFDCRMCGQCILHSTGMTCPETCPKNMRNGPCGGVRINGHCEVIPEMRCVWDEAFERSRQMPTYGHELIQIQPPANRLLEGSSAWINSLSGIESYLPEAWVQVTDIPVNNSEQSEKEKASWKQILSRAAG